MYVKLYFYSNNKISIALQMMRFTKVQLLIVWACLHIITHVKGNVMSERSFDKKLIVVISSVGYEDIGQEWIAMLATVLEKMKMTAVFVVTEETVCVLSLRMH